MGDFNAILSAADRTEGDSNWPRHQDDFASCMSQAELLQAPSTGLKFTWHNGQHGCNTIQKKLDWVFGNPSLFSTWPATHATFQARNVSDHSAMILSLHSLTHHQHSPFKFLNIWADRIDFLPTVTSSWQVPVNGNPMYQFTTKLRRLKSTLRQFHFQHTSSITDRVSKAKAEWETAQVHLDNHPTSATAMATERSLTSTYLQLCKDEESYYKQKSRVQWLQLGDRNTTFFHKSLLHRQVRNRIHNLHDEEGNIVHDQQGIGKMASTYFEKLLSTPQPMLTEDITSFFPNSITDESKVAALMAITDEDIRAALFSIPDAKAPGLDGYNSLFYKKSWDIIKADFIAAIRRSIVCNLPRLASHRMKDCRGMCPLNHSSLCMNLLSWTTANYCKKTNIQHLIARLVLSTTVYLLWYERNTRIFSHQYKAALTIAEEVYQLIRTYLATMEFNINIPAHICDIWGIQNIQPPPPAQS
uniref:Endonuclease/exonuclease/phosphatase domain-containing protein n=1 Tax=Populus alba TaxID=43335 RepID=A0A4U5Q8M5_POPAL|nr:hypothetical protein D5086_0000121610 [Populus alba]